MTRRLQISRPSEVIDIACGKGTTAVRLAKRTGCRVVGVDISEDLIAEARWLAKKARVEERVTGGLPVPQNT